MSGFPLTSEIHPGRRTGCLNFLNTAFRLVAPVSSYPARPASQESLFSGDSGWIKSSSLSAGTRIRMGDQLIPNFRQAIQALLHPRDGFIRDSAADLRLIDGSITDLPREYAANDHLFKITRSGLPEEVPARASRASDQSCAFGTT